MIAGACVVLPAVAAVLCTVRPLSAFVRAIAVASALGVSALAVGSSFAPSSSVQWRAAWAPTLGMSYAVDLDTVSALFLALAGVTFALGAAAGAHVGQRRAFFALWCLLLAALAGSFVARDLALFVAFWELTLVPVAVLQLRWGTHIRHRVTQAVVAPALVGSALLIVPVVSLAVARGTLDMAELAARPVPAGGQLLPALFLLAAFAMRLPLFPFHGWLPRMFVATPIPVAMVVAGGLASSAVYGVVRISLALFPQGMAAAAPALAALAATGVVYAAVVATRQDDFRRLIAYASISQLSLIAVALFAATATSLRGAVLATVAHGLVVPLLLLLAAMLARRTSSFALSRAGGLASSAPRLAALTGMAMLAAIGVPGTSGFAGTLLALAGAYERFPAAAAATGLGIVVSAIYGSRALARAYHGPAQVRGRDLAPRETLLVAPLLALIVLVGVAPAIITDRLADDDLPSFGAAR